MIRLIAAIDSQRGIATDSGIPWKLPGDTAYFREKTAHGLIVMGRATYDEFRGAAARRGELCPQPHHDALARRISGSHRPPAAPGDASGRRHLGHRWRHRLPGDDGRGGGAPPDAGARRTSTAPSSSRPTRLISSSRARASITTRPASRTGSKPGTAASRTRVPPASLLRSMVREADRNAAPGRCPIRCSA